MAEFQTSQEESFELLQYGKYSDFVLTCNGVEWNLHRAVVCIKSPVIAAALDGLFVEATLGRISSDFDVATMARLVQFLYVGDYSSCPLWAGTWPSLEVLWDEVMQNQLQDSGLPPSRCLEAEIGLNIAADYYRIPALSALTSSRVEELLNRHWNAAMFPAILKNAEDSVGDKGLWQVMIDGAATHMDSLTKTREFHEVGWKHDTYVQIFCAQVRMAEAEGRDKEMSSNHTDEQQHSGIHIMFQ